VPPPSRPADLRAWYSGDRFPIISCLCRSQLWCPRRGVPAQGEHPSGQVGAACAARHDIPHRAHHQRVWPGGSGRRLKCPRMPGANSAVSSGKTIRPGTPASGGPTQGCVRCPRMWRGSPAPWVMGGTGGGDRVRLWWECVGPEYRACHADLILGGRQVAKQQVGLHSPSPVGRGQGVESPRATPHGPTVPYFQPPPWPPVRAFHCRV